MRAELQWNERSQGNFAPKKWAQFEWLQISLAFPSGSVDVCRVIRKLHQADASACNSAYLGETNLCRERTRRLLCLRPDEIPSTLSWRTSVHSLMFWSLSLSLRYREKYLLVKGMNQIFLLEYLLYCFSILNGHRILRLHPNYLYTVLHKEWTFLFDFQYQFFPAEKYFILFLT